MSEPPFISILFSIHSGYKIPSLWFCPQDGESGWSSLHRALHFGHLAVAAALVEGGASLLLEDSKKRTPLDLISGDVKQTCDGQSELRLLAPPIYERMF